jgi:hypothetical protein
MDEHKLPLIVKGLTVLLWVERVIERVKKILSPFIYSL